MPPEIVQPGGQYTRCPIDEKPMQPEISRIQLPAGAVCAYRWGDRGPLLVYLHGWGDTGRSFQHVAAYLADTYSVVAIDWRGFGQSFRPPGNYYFPDYLADLDGILQHLSPEAPVTLIGHSMGGNIAALYAGIRPARVERLAVIEGFGLQDTSPATAPDRYRTWLESQQTSAAVSERPKERAALIKRITRNNPRLSDEQAAEVACWWAVPAGEDRVTLRMDARHRGPNPVLYRRAEAVACWRAIEAAVLLVYGGESATVSVTEVAAFKAELIASNGVETRRIDRAGHNLHLESPQALARIIRDWLE